MMQLPLRHTAFGTVAHTVAWEIPFGRPRDESVLFKGHPHHDKVGTHSGGSACLAFYTFTNQAAAFVCVGQWYTNISDIWESLPNCRCQKSDTKLFPFSELTVLE
jgi:hypothetical protein